MLPHPVKTRTWKDGTTPASGTPALGSLFNEEFDQLYANDIYIFNHILPVGSIIAWLPGYFINNSNGGFVPVAVGLEDMFIECTGALENDPDSLLYDGAGRYRPNLTDSRFLMGDIAGSCGAVGGNNSLAHTHAFTQPSAHGITQPSFTYPDHKHRVGYHDASDLRFYTETGVLEIVAQEVAAYGAGALVAAGIINDALYLYSRTDGGGSCTRTVNVALTNNHSGGAVGAATITENRPLYLSCRYIQRKK